MIKDKTNDEIDLLELFSALIKKLWLIVSVMILCAIFSFGFTKAFIKPEYTASVKMYVNNSSANISNKNSSISQSDISVAKNLVDTYGVILKTRLTLEEVIKEADLDYSYDELQKMVSSNSVNNTEAFEISVISNDPNESCLIANTIAKVLPDKISRVVEGCSVKIVDNAVVPEKRSSPSYSKNTIIGALFGIVFSVGLILLSYYVNDTIDIEVWLMESFGEEIPILATIPDVDDSSVKKKGYGYGNR